MTATVYEIDPSLATPDDLRLDPKLAEEADLMYASSQSGPRSVLPCSLSYLPLSHFIPTDELAAFASRALPSANSRSRRDGIRVRQFSPEKRLGQVEYIFDVGNWSTAFESLPGKKYGTMLKILQYPFSKGSIHIPLQASPDRPTTSDDQPVIDPQYYVGEGGQVDFDIMTAAQKFGDKICHTHPSHR